MVSQASMRGRIAGLVIIITALVRVAGRAASSEMGEAGGHMDGVHADCPTAPRFVAYQHGNGTTGRRCRTNAVDCVTYCYINTCTLWDRLSISIGWGRHLPPYIPMQH